MLLDIALKSKDPKIILEGLKIAANPSLPTTAEQIGSYKEKFYEETLLLVTEGAFSLTQVCIQTIGLTFKRS